MKLPDFTQDELFNQLRLQMGQAEFGNFELFDAARHLSWSEREALQKNQLQVSFYQLTTQQGKYLAFKNSRVFYLAADGVSHFALCDELKKQREKHASAQVPVSLNTALIAKNTVCPYCLHAITYQGFDVYRTRHKEYAEAVLKDFNWAEFFRAHGPQ